MPDLLVNETVGRFLPSCIPQESAAPVAICTAIHPRQNPGLVKKFNHEGEQNSVEPKSKDQFHLRKTLRSVILFKSVERLFPLQSQTLVLRYLALSRDMSHFGGR